LLFHLLQGIDHRCQQLLGLFRDRTRMVFAKLFNEVGLPADPLLGFCDVLIDYVEIAS
jgi:hypothetical protein